MKMKMKTVSYKVSDHLYLVRHEIGGSSKNPVDIPVNHVVVIDCSGSMCSDLPHIREQLKKKLPKMLKENHTISIVWFSGRGQFGVLLEAQPVATFADLKDVNSAIDRCPKCIGLTGFKEPIEEAAALVARVAKKRPGSIFSLFFMSDGCDNQWPRQDILKTVEKAAGSFSSSTFVEYGYYADRLLLTAMAEKAGGTFIFADDFDRYASLFEAAMQKALSGATRVEVQVKADTVGGFAWALVSGDLMTFSVESGRARIPEDLAEVWYLSPSPVGDMGRAVVDISKESFHFQNTKAEADVLSAAYAAISLFSIRMKPDVVLPVLKATGDSNLISAFSGCFGKQKYSEFMDVAKTAAFDPKARWVAGWDPNEVPKDDVFTVLDMLRILSEDDGNRLLLEDPNFKYSRVSRGRIDASSVLTDEEQAEIEKLPEALKFEADPAPDGYPIANLTFNEDCPNISVLVRKTGVVDVSKRVPENIAKKIPTKFPTFVFRNYAIVKDGLVNVTTLPVKLSGRTNQKLTGLLRDGVIPQGTVSFDGDGRALIFLDTLPVINRKMVKEVSAKDFFTRQYELTKARAAQKVYNAYAKDLLLSKRAESIAAQYGEDAASWLVEQGITDGGFNPKSVQMKSTDFYISKELKVSLKGLSKFPSLKELREQVAKGKLTHSGLLMKPAYDDVEAFLASPTYQKAANKDKILEEWLEERACTSRMAVRELIFETAKTTFGLIVGQVWFSEFKSLDENTMTIDVDGQKVECKVEMLEREVRL